LNGQQEEGFTLHFGCLIVGIALAVAGVIIFLTAGWRWLWLIPAAAVSLWVLMFIVSLFESRWLAVTPEHVQRGVPAHCSQCGEGLSVVISATRFKTRCPICGHRESGHFSGS
jgi:hypothetical protein